LSTVGIIAALVFVTNTRAGCASVRHDERGGAGVVQVHVREAYGVDLLAVLEDGEVRREVDLLAGGVRVGRQAAVGHHAADDGIAIHDVEQAAGDLDRAFGCVSTETVGANSVGHCWPPFCGLL
jgi:hypothetical protein